MSHFYGNLKGCRGETTRCGTKGSGIRSHVRGWNVGCRVDCFVDEHGEDCVRVYITGGSNGRLEDKFIGVWQRMDDMLVKME